MSKAAGYALEVDEIVKGLRLGLHLLYLSPAIREKTDSGKYTGLGALCEASAPKSHPPGFAFSAGPNLMRLGCNL